MLQSLSTAVPVELLPQQSADETKSEPCNSREDSCSNDDPEEIPETAHKRPAVEVRREQPPREGSRADESGEKSDVRGEIFYRRAAKVVELGKNRCSRAMGSA